ncbi:siderophore ABC transporter substrate-binding protein [Enteractinococcus helveticum]|uniref:siderophore ABC transporter substrate-binding protein n=1 Tax=Enteractinococcus helveticum TaxID=1837282 RepID=UPI000AF0FA42|nr:ABC transporter substrate-binding protein [Enteractinococcus helveticum]
MKNFGLTRYRVAALLAVGALGLSACGTANSDDTAEAESNGGDAATVEVTDMAGTALTVPTEPQSVIATDNRVFRTLAEWDIDLSAAPVDLMATDQPVLEKYTQNEDILNIGNHREPNMELVTAAQPDLVINGQRFSQHGEAIAEAIDEGVPIVDTDIDTESGAIDQEFRDQITLLGEVFGHQDDAETLIADFDEALDRAKEAYDSEVTVTGLVTSGGDINYAAPTTGRAIGPLYDILELTPALDDEGSTDHQGDDISVEAIASANPDFLIVMDRDAAVGDGTSAGAKELIEESEALQDVPAVANDNIYYMPADFYVAEDIQNYTTVLNELADKWSE